MAGTWLPSLAFFVLLSSCIADDPNVQVESIIHFAVAGFALLKGLLKDELKDARIKDAVKSARTAAELAYFSGARGFMASEYGLREQCADCFRSFGEESWQSYRDLPKLVLEQRLSKAVIALRCCQEHGRALCSSDVVATCDDAGLPRLPFHQLLNLHRYNQAMFQLATSSKLAAAAAVLLQEPQVRLYQTALFAKEPGKASNNLTTWHRDLSQVPIDTSAYITFWCPLHRSLRKGDSLLSFAKRSHTDVAYFVHALQNYSDDSIRERYEVNYMDGLRVGDCSAHHGWTLHFAPPQLNSKKSRHAVAFSFVAAGARTLSKTPRAVEDHVSWAPWFQEVGIGNRIDHPLLPVVWPRQGSSTEFPQMEL